MEEWMLSAEIPESLTAMGEAPAPLDAELVAQAATGDHAAFTTLFYQTYRYAFSQVAALLTADEDIRDVLQEVYTRVYTGLPRLREPAAFLGWLKTIARNCALTQRAKNQNDPLSTALYAEGTEEVFLAEETPREPALDIRAVLESLPEEQARLLVLVYYDGMKLAEIARLEGLPASTVRSRFAAAKRALQKALKGRGIDRTVYARGGFFSAVGTALRDAIGTEVLSAAVAQDILNEVLKGSKPAPIGYVAAKLSRRRRNAAVLRIAALVVALSLAASAIMATIITRRDTLPVAQPAPSTTTGETAGATTTASSEEMGVIVPSATTTTTTTDVSQEPGSTVPPSAPPSQDTAEPERPTPTLPVAGSTTDGTAPDTTAGTTGGSAVTQPTTTGSFPAISKGTTTTTRPTVGTTTPVPTTITAKPTTTTARPTTTTKRTTTAPITTTTMMVPIVVPEVFVPDYRPGHANVLGNNKANVERWRAFIAEQDGWLYFFTESNRLMKQNMETGHTTPIYQAPTGDTIRALNVVGDWLYFANNSKGIMRIRTDGSGLERMFAQPVSWLLVRGDELFYTYNSNLCVMDIPTRKASVVEHSVSSAYVCEKVVYYDKRVSANAFDLYQWTKENGSELVSATADYFLANGDTAVYYRKSGGMVARSQDGQERFYPWKEMEALGGCIWEYDDWLVEVGDMIRQMRLSDGVFANSEYLAFPPTDLSVAGLKSGLYWWQNGALYCRKWGGLAFLGEEILWKP